MNDRELERLLDAVRSAQPNAQIVGEASARVRERLNEHKQHAGATVLPFIHVINAKTPKRFLFSRRLVAMAAAAVLTVGLGLALPPVRDRNLLPIGPRGTVAAVDGTLLRVSSGEVQRLDVGTAIEDGQELRTGRDSRAVIRLADGSQVEMAQRTTLNVTARWFNKTIHLTRGSVMVEAAKQRVGRLEVATAEALVSVKGTIFNVNRGLQGSRVSVVEGEVQVDQNQLSQLLHRGEQSTSDARMAASSLADEIGWSQNANKYMALLAGLDVVANRLNSLKMPGLRYSSDLLDRVPADSVLVASIPNLGEVLGEVTQIFEERAKDNAAVSEWWNSARSQQIREAVDKIRTASDYLGDEILIAGPKKGSLVIVAKLQREGLREYLAQAGFSGPVAFEGDMVAIGASSVPASGDFPSSPFGTRILDSYREGAGLLLAINLEQIGVGVVQHGMVPSIPPSATTTSEPNPANSGLGMANFAGLNLAGIDAARFFVVERKTNATQGSLPDNTASLSFAGARHGLMNWLATPGPMGSLDFISAQASFAAAFVTRDPSELLQDLFRAAGTGAAGGLQAIQNQAGGNPFTEIAAALGSEAAIAVDGTLLPVPEWKVAVEVEDPVRLQSAIEKLAQTVSRNTEQAVLDKQLVDGRMFYTLTLRQPVIAIHYTFVDGYLLAGAHRGLLLSAIGNRSTSLTLPHSADFQTQLSSQASGNYSGILYYNFGRVVGPMADQLNATGLVPPEQQEQLRTLTANREPAIVYLKAEADRMTIGSRSNLLSLGLRTLSGFASGQAWAGIPFFGMTQGQAPSR